MIKQEQADALHQELFARADQFEPVQLRKPTILNAVPKNGLHLLRNILIMFGHPDKCLLDEFLYEHNLETYQNAISGQSNLLSWGHVNGTRRAIELAHDASVVLLVRDPIDYVLALTRFVYDENYDAPFGQYARKNLSVDQTIHAVIAGHENPLQIGVQEMYQQTFFSWWDKHPDVSAFRYEDLIKHTNDLHTDEADVFFSRLFEIFDQRPLDWRARIQAGADKRLSVTARENLIVNTEIPRTLSDLQMELLEKKAPSLRERLGYAAN